MNEQARLLEVWLDCDLGPACLVGRLAHDRGQVRFHYESAWLADSRAFVLDPDLSLDAAPFFPRPELGNFGIFLDSSPDRWGQTVLSTTSTHTPGRGASVAPRFAFCQAAQRRPWFGLSVRLRVGIIPSGSARETSPAPARADVRGG